MNPRSVHRPSTPIHPSQAPDSGSAAGSDRRHFLTTLSRGATALGLAATCSPLYAALPFPAPALTSPTFCPSPSQRAIYRTLKIGMIGVGANLTEKFDAAKKAGFQGVELNAPGIDVDETLAAIKATGLRVDGSVCASHWEIRHTSPEASIREQALSHLKTAIEQTHAVGGNTVLLVVGHGKDGPEEEIWKRSIENIKQALPLAAERGVYIAIENVWNHFLYDHKGNDQQTADKFVKYVDEFDSPWVGMQFDLGNHWKYGDPAAWVRQLGKRVVKLDIKGFSRADNAFKNITGGDIDWASVRKALDDIRFTGWCAAEVDGGDLAHLTRVAMEIDVAMGIQS